MVTERAMVLWFASSPELHQHQVASNSSSLNSSNRINCSHFRSAMSVGLSSRPSRGDIIVGYADRSSATIVAVTSYLERLLATVTLRFVL